MSDQAPGAEPHFDAESTARALETFRRLPVQLAEQRIAAVGNKCEEILRGLIAAVQDASPAWNLELKSSWWDSQLEVIAGTLAKVKSSLPCELAEQVGGELIADVHHKVTETVDRGSAAVVERCTSVLEAAFPEVDVYRADRPAREARMQLEEQGERIVELESVAIAASARANRASFLSIAALILAVVGWCGR